MPHCKLKGRSTTRSSKCLHHKGVPTGIPLAAGLQEGTGPIATAARNSLVQAIGDMRNYDTAAPLSDDPPDDVSLTAFLADQAWSDGEDIDTTL
jgi:hypothetical protein